MNFLTLLLFWGLILGASMSSARTLSQEEQRQYFLTYESCRLYKSDRSIKGLIISNLNPQGLDVMFNTLGEINHVTSEVFAGRTQALERVKSNGGLGPYIAELLQSEGFHSALRDCFPDESTRQSYVRNLLLLDGAAKFAVLASTTIGYLRFLKWIRFYFHTAWAKAIFLGYSTSLLTASSSQTFRSSEELMADQYQNLSSQIEQLLKAETQKKLP